MKQWYQRSRVKTRADRSLEQVVAKNLREIRLSRGLSIRELAKLGGPNYTTQSLAEHASVGVTITTLVAFGRIVKVPIKDFFLREQGEPLDDVLRLIYEMNEQGIQVLRSKLERMVV